MVKWFLRLKHNKLLFSIAISIAVVMAVSLFIVLFDLIEIAKLQGNAAGLSELFIFFNIMLIICAIYIVGATIFIVVNRQKKI